MSQSHLPLTADDLVHLCIDRLEDIEEDAFPEKETMLAFAADLAMRRSEERRVGKECRL